MYRRARFWALASLDCDVGGFKVMASPHLESSMSSATRDNMVSFALFVACVSVADALTLGTVLAIGYIAALFFS